MSEFINSTTQSIAVNSNVLFNETPVEPCPCVRHRKGSGIFTLRGGHTYNASFFANISGATAGTEVDLAFTIGGEEVAGTRMASTPAVADDLNNVGSSVVIVVPCGCCYTLAVENVGTTAATVANANLIITKEG